MSPDQAGISVIVPTLNEEKNIPRLLSSIPREVQVIVVDSGTDRTAEIVESRPNSKVVRKKANIPQARNTGAEHASADILVFTDADVAFADDYFNRLRQGGPIDLRYGPKLSADGKYEQHYLWTARGQRLSQAIGIPAVSGSNMVVSRDVFEAIGGFREELRVNEDSQAGWDMKVAGFNCEFDPKLKVFAFDHRRLERGSTKKTVHSIVRCTILWSGLMPRGFRSRDWGYWS